MVIQGWDKGLEGQKVGSRIEMSIPPELGYGEQAKGDIPANATLVFVVDILKATTDPGVRQGHRGRPGQHRPAEGGHQHRRQGPLGHLPQGADPPKKLVSNYVLEGTGPVITAKDTVVVNYEAYLWKAARSSTARTSAGKTQTFPLAQVTLKGLKDGLVGKKVGSRVLLVIPPDQAFGDKEKQGIPKNSTLVFAVDLLTKV